MVKGTKKPSPEINGKTKANNRSRRTKEASPEDSSVGDSIDGNESLNGVEPSSHQKQRSFSRKRSARDRTPDNQEADESEDDDMEENDQETEDSENSGVDSSDDESSEVHGVMARSRRGNKRKANGTKGELNSSVTEHGKRRRQVKAKPEAQSPPNRPSSKSPITASPKRGRPRRSNPIINLDDVTKTRMNELVNAVRQYAKNGRKLISPFYGLPPKAQYADYYEVVSEPIDMYMIEERISDNRYHGERALLYDLSLMLKNAKSYNEEDSVLYNDSHILEQHLKATWKKISSEKDEKVDPLYILFEAIFDFEDETGRQLIVPFMKLPTKSEFPMYYEVIRRPIDVARIRDRLFGGSYALLDDMVSDFRLLFDNSCKFNEPDSQLYRDSLTLLKICNTKRQEILGIPNIPDDRNIPPVDPVPDAFAVLQSMMRELLSFINQCRPCAANGMENGSPPDVFLKLFSDLVPPADTIAAGKLSQMPPLSALELIRQNVEQGRYRRLDRFQDDVFEVLHNVRTIAASSTPAFQASIKLQEEFIKKRDAVIEFGRRLYTPASHYGLNEMQADVERDVGATFHSQGNDEAYHSDGEEESQDTAARKEISSVSASGTSYAIGDYVHVRNFSAGASEKRIIQIRRMWEDEASHQQMIEGVVFLRPEETYHMVNRKFYPNEVFISDGKHTGPSTAITGRCLVLLPRLFSRYSAEGLAEEDVFICDTRYSLRSRVMSKIRGWKDVFILREDTNQHNGENQNSEGGELMANSVKLTKRENVVVPKRNVPSVFAVRQQELAEASNSSEASTVLFLDKFRQNVPLSPPENAPALQEGMQLFEQLIGSGPEKISVKLGDFVFLSIPHYPNIVIRIEKLFNQTGPDGVASFVAGTRLFAPPEISPGPHDPNSKELFMSCQQETHPFSRVVSRCLVLGVREYCGLRCPEINEKNTFYCEAECLPPEQPNTPLRFRKIQSVAVPNLKKFSHNVIEDEVYFLPKPITIRKPMPQGVGHHIPLGSTSSTSTVESHRMNHQMVDESSFGGHDELSRVAALSGHDDFKITNSPSSSHAHSDIHGSAKRGGGSHRGRMKTSRGGGTVSGWTVFSRCMHQEPSMAPVLAGRDFPERAKIIAEKWRLLPADEKNKYVEMAKAEDEIKKQKRAAAAAAAFANEATSVSSIDAAKSPAPNPMMNQPPQGFPNNQQAQMMMTPNGPMMVPHQQPFFPDQMQNHPPMPPHGMPGPFPNGNAFFQRPPGPPQIYQQPQQGGQFPMQHHQMQQPPYGGNMPPQMMPPHGFAAQTGHHYPPFMNGHPHQPPANSHQPPAHPHHPQMPVDGVIPQNFHQQPHHFAPAGMQQNMSPTFQSHPQPLPHPQQPQQHPTHPPQQQVPPPPQQFQPQPGNPVNQVPQQLQQMPVSNQPQTIHVQKPPAPQSMPPQANTPINGQGHPYQPVSSSAQPNRSHASPQPTPVQSQESVRPAVPMVHAVPPRQNRLVHSEAFLRYLDGLGRNSDAANSRPFISDWPRSLTVTENHVSHALQNNQSRMRLTSMVGPALLNGNGSVPGPEAPRAAVVSALYKLNSDLISDSLNLSHVLDYEQL